MPEVRLRCPLCDATSPVYPVSLGVPSRVWWVEHLRRAHTPTPIIERLDTSS